MQTNPIPAMTASPVCILRLSFSVLFAALLQSTAAPVAPAPDREPLKLIRTVEPLYPLRLQAEGIKEGDAQLAISVDEQGRLQDYLVIGYSRKEFADAAVAALKRWQFEPMRLRGEPHPVTQELWITFESRGLAVVSETASEHIQRRIERLAPGLLAYRVYTLRELDRLPVPREVVAPVYSQALADRGITGRVSVEFFIDETGRVRLPSVRESAHNELAVEAVVAVRRWRFDPPLRNGRPVLVRAIQDFNFSPQPGRSD